MTKPNYLNELMKRHKKIEVALHEAQMHPSVDQLEIRALKQQKLILKDEIERARRAMTVSHLGIIQAA